MMLSTIISYDWSLGMAIVSERAFSTETDSANIAGQCYENNGSSEK